jgi:hypothetical protein
VQAAEQLCGCRNAHRPRFLACAARMWDPTRQVLTVDVEHSVVLEEQLLARSPPCEAALAHSCALTRSIVRYSPSSESGASFLQLDR